MVYLPLANLLHHKLRTALSALGIGIGICMLVTLSGLSRGSLNEVADRWEAVRADLIAYPRGLGDNATTLSGIGVSDRLGQMLAQEHADVVESVVPVFVWPLKLAGQDQMSAGVDAPHVSVVAGGRKLVAGRLFSPRLSWEAFVAQVVAEAAASRPGDGADPEALFDPSPDQLAAGGWLELVIDERLAAAGHYRVGDRVELYGHRWTIVGVVEAGGMTRVLLPRRTAQYLFGSGDTSRSTLMFIRLRPGAEAASAARKLLNARVEIVQLRQYRDMLQHRWGMMFRYVDAVNAVALVISFLFIMVTLYTMVIQEMREIAILKSCGASRAFILRQVLGESLLMTACGTAMGIALSFLAAWLIETFRPLLTVTITWQWVAIAVGAAAAGAMVSGLYPAWRATRVDMVSALTYE